MSLGIRETIDTPEVKNLIDLYSSKYKERGQIVTRSFQMSTWISRPMDLSSGPEPQTVKGADDVSRWLAHPRPGRRLWIASSSPQWSSSYLDGSYLARVGQRGDRSVLRLSSVSFCFFRVILEPQADVYCFLLSVLLSCASWLRCPGDEDHVDDALAAGGWIQGEGEAVLHGPGLVE